MKAKLFLLSLFAISNLFIGDFVFAQDIAVSTTSQNVINNTENIQVQSRLSYEDEYRIRKDLVGDVAAWNLGYITILVMIILFLAGMNYFGSYKPLQKKIKMQAKKIKSLIADNEVKSKTLELQIENNKKELGDEFGKYKLKMDEFDQQFKTSSQDFKNKFLDLQYSIYETNSNLWLGLSDTYVAFLSSLLCLQHCVIYNDVEKMRRSLDSISSIMDFLISKIEKGDIEKVARDNYDNLINWLDKIQNHEEIIKQIKDKIPKVFKDL